MRIILILLGIFWIIAGVLLFILTDASKEILRNFLKNKNLKALSILPLIAGLLLIGGSSLVEMPWIAVTLGSLGLLKGLFFIFGPEDKSRALIDWWLNTSNAILKSWGVAVFLLGVLLLLIL